MSYQTLSLTGFAHTGLSVPTVLVRLIRPARVGPWVTVQEVIDRHSGLCRVTMNGRPPGRSYLTIIDPAIADEGRARRLVQYLNDGSTANILHGLAELGERGPSQCEHPNSQAARLG